ncbi:MAG: hypothetical protein JSW61_15370 [Candidatus Thorarchaeota archaeon]|nr:MAG: hypothetical protein JSW61_15370 [Candidatus Thorarchaeota archaeon]
MGKFDRLRRIRVTKSEDVRDREGKTTRSQSKMYSLVNEFEELEKRREEILLERDELARRLDAGEITAIEYRKQLMMKMQEAAQVTERMKALASKLEGMGYKGVLQKYEAERTSGTMKDVLKTKE